jgi:hypothetical protein
VFYGIQHGFSGTQEMTALPIMDALEWNAQKSMANAFTTLKSAT